MYQQDNVATSYGCKSWALKKAKNNGSTPLNEMIKTDIARVMDNEQNERLDSICNGQDTVKQCQIQKVEILR